MLREKTAGDLAAPRPSLHVLLTGVSSDSHTWNLVFMQLLLQHMGHRVTNLGACTPDEEVAQACLDLAPDLLVVSTVNGLGNIDGERLIRQIRQAPGLRHLPAVIGGKLGIRGVDNRSFAHDLLDAGYSAVFEDDAALARFAAYVEQVCTERADAPMLEASA